MKPKKIGIIGTGITGLTVAYLLHQKGHRVFLFEKQLLPGGNIGTKMDHGFILEAGPIGFLDTCSQTLDLIEMLNLTTEIITQKTEVLDGHIYSKNSLQNLSEFQKSSSSLSIKKIFSFLAKNEKEEESEANHKDLFEILFEKPLLTEDLNKNNLLSFKRGLATLVLSLARQFDEELFYDSEVKSIKTKKNSIEFEFLDDSDQRDLEFDEVIACCGPQALSKILPEHFTKETHEFLNDFPTLDLRTVTFSFNGKLDYEGFGGLIMPDEDICFSAFLKNNAIFDNRSPQGKDLVTVFLSRPDTLKWSTQRVLRGTLEDLEKVFKTLPKVLNYSLWNHIPGVPMTDSQKESMERFQQELNMFKGLHVASSFVGGYSINDCIRKAFKIADQFEIASY